MWTQITSPSQNPWSDIQAFTNALQETHMAVRGFHKTWGHGLWKSGIQVWLENLLSKTHACMIYLHGVIWLCFIYTAELETRIEGRSGSKACLMENVAYACTVLESIHLWRINDFNLSIEVNSMPISHPPFVFTGGGPSLTLLNVTIFPSLNGTNIRCSATHFIRETIVRIEAGEWVESWLICFQMESEVF